MAALGCTLNDATMAEIDSGTKKGNDLGALTCRRVFLTRKSPGLNSKDERN